ncbi:alpha/beta fold hydrolase [Hyalangium minutum]|uniref:Alpha/beta hydrolase fold protein n=1 Tax=Hyalangium minutum TaxID=394096 RepID=A0A085W6U9_9BACT|nr:alpha/beta hydrolase [Hyalangium minutum]KFE63412.1 alpha/beta hydrolase fold protein [Hyalangium minutum]
MNLLCRNIPFFVLFLVALGTSAFAQPKQKAPGSYAKVNGLELYYETHGKGRPLVLLHGGLGSTSMFGDNLKALAKHYKVIAVDLQGHGRTADIDRPLSVELMADDVAALIQHLKLGKADVFGYSLGGGVALLVGIRHPELVNKLVIVSTVFRRDAFYPEILAQQGQVNEGAVEMMKQTPMYQGYAAVAPRPQDFPRLLKKIGEAMKQDFDFSKQIASLQAPTLVMAADADLFPASHAVEFFGLLGGGKRDGGWDGSGRPKSRLAILPGLTHYNIFADPLMVTVALPFLQEGT